MHTLVIDADSRLVLAAVGAAISFIVAAVASWCMVVFRVIVDGHADRMESAAHFQVAGIRQEVRNVNWLTTNKFRGEARAFIDAANAYGDPSETGPMRIINGAG
ncbi:hypothetical protein [Nonomuraea pusilla]|uniref:hypothetical protein n=1 Tax=Nonomuraea pusilla TaxID=46177 RepID=UPI0011602287|nr:hypothetical protein [Nonomuraea pusilla]